MNKKSSRIVKLGFALLEAVFGILLLINPTAFASTIVVILGVITALAGALGIFLYFSTSPTDAARNHDFAYGLLAIIAGIFCIAKSGWILSIFPLVTMLFGLLALVIGVLKLQDTIDIARTRACSWYWSAIGTALTLICSFIIFWNPFSSTKVVWMFIAISLIGVALYDMAAILLRKEDKRK